MPLTLVPASMQEPTAQFMSFKNRIINGDMAISQRGTSFSSPANQSYTLDRWKFWADGSGGTLAISRVALSPAELNPFSYAMRINQSVGATGRTYFRINQHIEGLEIFSGQQIVVSFYAKCASGTVASTLRCDRYYGTGGSPSSADNITASAGLNQTITTTWARYTALATVTSTSGKTYGTNNDSSLLVGIDLPVSGTFDLYLTGFQVEFGTTLNATSFDMRFYPTELQLCQRYYELVPSQAAGFLNTNGGTASVAATIFWKTTKRTTPTVTVGTGAIQQSGTDSVISYQSTGGSSWYFTSAVTGTAEL
jgi:hypothetical protein